MILHADDGFADTYKFSSDFLGMRVLQKEEKKDDFMKREEKLEPKKSIQIVSLIILIIMIGLVSSATLELLPACML